tara:strand:+ start:137 stop:481 length:345 start_codon:yes stop_codon:yes gene_type:complete
MIPNFMRKKLLNLKFFFISLFILNLFFFSKSFADEYSKGKEIFLGSGNCASCHSLTDAGSDANIGPNLNEIRPNLMRVLMSVTNGAGVMPSYQGILTEEEIKAVAIYVSESASK